MLQSLGLGGGGGTPLFGEVGSGSDWSRVGVLWVGVESGMAGREERSPTVTAHAVALVGEASCSGGAVEWGLGVKGRGREGSRWL